MARAPALLFHHQRGLRYLKNYTAAAGAGGFGFAAEGSGAKEIAGGVAEDIAEKRVAAIASARERIEGTLGPSGRGGSNFEDHAATVIAGCAVVAAVFGNAIEIAG